MAETSNIFPAGLLERVRKINNVYKQTVRLLPVNQGSVVNGNKILLQFPIESVIDLKSLSFDAMVQTCQAGNQSGTAASNYTQTYYLPRGGLASMISQLDVRVNGRSIQNISQYSYLYNIISDWVYNGSTNTDDVAAVADPSIMTYYDAGRLVTRRGYPVSYWDTTSSTSIINNKQSRLLDRYSCRKFLGFLGEGSTSIINTAMIGDLTLEITLEGTNVLIAGAVVPNAWPIIPTTVNTIDAFDTSAADLILFADTVKAATATDSFNGKVMDMQNYYKLTRGFSSGDTGIANVGNVVNAAASVGTNFTDAATKAAVVADNISFTLSDIVFYVVRYELDNSYYSALNMALDRNHEFDIYFKNYQIFTGTASIDKSQSMRVSVSSQSLNYLIGTFQAPNRTNICQPINTLISPPQSGESGLYAATFDNQVASGMPRTFNNALYFVRNGSKIKSSKWSVDQQEYPTKNLYDVYNENLRHWDKFGKPEDIYKGIQSIYHFQETFYTDILSLETPDQYKDGHYQVSGINCKGQPLNIIYNTVGGDDVSNYQKVNPTVIADVVTANKNGFSAFDLYLDTASAYTPIIVANFTSKISISKGRNVAYYN
jgi:hypothetical protein